MNIKHAAMLYVVAEHELENWIWKIIAIFQEDEIQLVQTISTNEMFLSYDEAMQDGQYWCGLFLASSV